MNIKLDIIYENSMSANSRNLALRARSEDIQKNAVISKTFTEKAKTPSQDAKQLRSLLENDLENALNAVKDEKLSAARKKEAAEHLFNAFSRNNVFIRFDIDNELHDQLVVKLISKSSGEVVWQLPPEHSIQLQKLAKLFPGIYLNEMA